MTTRSPWQESSTSSPPPHADLLQEPDRDLDAKAVVGPLDHMRARHRGDLLRDVSMPDTCLLRLFQFRRIVDQQADYGFQSACFLLRRLHTVLGGQSVQQVLMFFRQQDQAIDSSSRRPSWEAFYSLLAYEFALRSSGDASLLRRSLDEFIFSQYCGFLRRKSAHFSKSCGSRTAWKTRGQDGRILLRHCIPRNVSNSRTLWGPAQWPEAWPSP